MLLELQQFLAREFQPAMYMLITWTSKVKYFFKFFMIITRKGSLMPSVFLGSAGHVMKVVLQMKKIQAWNKRLSLELYAIDKQ